MSRIQILLSCVGNIVQRVEFINNEFIFYLDPKHLLSFTRFLKFNSLVKYEQLMDITGVDYPSRKQRFEVVYQFLTIRPDVQYRRLRVKTLVDALTPIESITSVYPTAGWFERELWDMFGVFVLNHSDLHRILNDYGFQGYPLRKDFPITGYYQVRYDEEVKRVVSEPVELAQQIRTFDYVGPWIQNSSKRPAQ